MILATFGVNSTASPPYLIISEAPVSIIVTNLLCLPGPAPDNLAPSSTILDSASGNEQFCNMVVHYNDPDSAASILSDMCVTFEDLDDASVAAGKEPFTLYPCDPTGVVNGVMSQVWVYDSVSGTVQPTKLG
jgi:hypothetical protein